MNEIVHHINHLLSFDGVLHWCFWIAVFGSLIGSIWVTVRILIPLRRLARQAASIMEGELPDFDRPVSGIREIEQFRQSLHYMIGEIKTGQEREANYRDSLTSSLENERKRIAREIHDDTIQSLVLVSHSMERAMGTADANTRGYLEKARRQVVQTIDGLRQMMVDLRPTILDELGLAAAIEVLCETHQTLKFSMTGDVYDIDKAYELAMFRAAQEAIHNAECHAQAQHIAAKLTYSPTAVTLEVTDDGVGFQIPRQLQEFSMQGHYGLIGIRERILHLGGQLNLVSQPAVGTRMVVTLPTLQAVALAV